MSIAARGKMRKLRDLGEAMPISWALDVNGNPTTDPAAGLNGFIQFIGGHKGYGLSLMVEMLGGLLSGGRFLDDVGDMWAEKENRRCQPLLHRPEPNPSNGLAITMTVWRAS